MQRSTWSKSQIAKLNERQLKVYNDLEKFVDEFYKEQYRILRANYDEEYGAHKAFRKQKDDFKAKLHEHFKGQDYEDTVEFIEYNYMPVVAISVIVDELRFFRAIQVYI